VQGGLVILVARAAKEEFMKKSRSPKKPTSARAETTEAVPTLSGPRTSSEVIVLTVSVIALIALGQSVHVVLSPFVLVGAIIYLLYPLRNTPLAGRLMWLSILVFVIWFLYSLLPLLAPFILALVIAYIFNPLVSVLERRRIPRWASSLIIVLLLIGTVIAAFLFIMPIVVQQFNGILNGVKGITNDLAELLRSGTIFEVLASFGIPVEKSRAMISEHITPKLENVLTSLLSGVFGFVTGISSVVLQIINAVIIPFLVFYMLKDFPDIMRMFLRLAPHHQRIRMESVGTQVDSLLGRYLRGAIVVALLQGSIATVGLALIGVKYALVLGIMTGVLNFIPYVGLLTSLVVSSMVALFSGDPVLSKVVLVVIMYLSQKLLEASVFAPKIIGSQVGLHPVLLILCLLVFGFFLGFVGLLIAVPASALIVAGVDAWETKREEGIQSESYGKQP